MDSFGNKVATLEIAMMKVVAPRMLMSVVNREIHGGAGLNIDSNWKTYASMWFMPEHDYP